MQVIIIVSGGVVQSVHAKGGADIVLVDFDDDEPVVAEYPASPVEEIDSEVSVAIGKNAIMSM